jgi:hypothetical protein
MLAQPRMLVKQANQAIDLPRVTYRQLAKGVEESIKDRHSVSVEDARKMLGLTSYTVKYNSQILAGELLDRKVRGVVVDDRLVH